MGAVIFIRIRGTLQNSICNRAEKTRGLKKKSICNCSGLCFRLSVRSGRGGAVGAQVVSWV